MKEKILTELKKKYPGLSNELLGLIAEKMTVKVTAEDQIQGGITELENSPISISDYAAFLQKETDKRVTSATQTHEQTLRSKYDFKEKGTPVLDNDPLKTADPEVKKQLEVMQQKLANLETKGAKQKLQDEFIKKLTDKKIPLQFAKGLMVEKAEDIDALLLEAETAFTEVKQTFVNDGLSTTTSPIGSTVKTDNVDADIKSWAQTNAKKEEAAKK